jgi:hypothetical protein
MMAAETATPPVPRACFRATEKGRDVFTTLRQQKNGTSILLRVPSLQGMEPRLDDFYQGWVLLRALALFIALTAGPPDPAVGEDSHYRGQYQDEKQEDDGFDWH